MQRWYVVQSEPGRETMALAHLDRQGFAPLLPLEVQWRTKRGLRYLHHKPYASGYLFVHFDVATARWRSINGTRGVRKIFTDASGEHPRPVGDAEMDKFLEKAKTAGTAPDDGNPPPPWKHGELVAIVGGIYDDHKGIFSGPDDDAAHARVVMSLFGRDVPVPVQWAHIQAA